MTLRRVPLFLFLVPVSPLPLSKRDDSRMSVPASIYTPTVVIFVVFVCLAALGCLVRAFLRRSRAAQIANATAVTNQTGNPTDTPAEQLTSTLNADVAGIGNSTIANPTRLPRRHRRPRRTPSQVSVTSLPEYMKEPGEHELVIGQGPARTHTLTMPTSALDDDEDAQTPGSSQYYPIPTSTNTMPLLHEQGQEQQERGRDRDSDSNDNNDTHDISLQDLSHQRQRTGGSTSIDTTRSDSANTHTQSLSPTSISTFPLGAAPPLPPAYFEVVADDDVPLSAQAYYPPHASSSRYSVLSTSTSTFSTSHAPLLGHNNASSSTSILPEATRAGTTTRANNRNRQSGFRTFLNRMSMSMPTGVAPSNGGGAGHQRSESNNSNTSTTSFFRRPGSSLSSISLAMNQNQTHHTRQNPSISQSRASLLSSPSTVSINSLSISAPLTHTASRTQFMFPQSKSSMTTATMTPEQMRVITAREAIGRFGVPYGPDAVAFAAAKESGVGVGPPPPGFEEVVGSGSGLRLDNENDVVEEGHGDGHGVREISTSSVATVRVGPVSGSGPSGVGVGAGIKGGDEGASPQTRTRSRSSQSRVAILEPKPNIPFSSSPYTNGINASPPPSTTTSPSTPTQLSTSEFGTLSSKFLSPNDNNNDNNNDILRSGSISSNLSSQTYATAAESLTLSVSSSVPLTTPSSNSTSRSSSYSAAAGVDDVVRGWSSSEEEELDGDGDVGEGRGMVDEVGSVTPRIARLGLDREPSRVVVS